MRSSYWQKLVIDFYIPQFPVFVSCINIRYVRVYSKSVCCSSFSSIRTVWGIVSVGFKVRMITKLVRTTGKLAKNIFHFLKSREVMFYHQHD